MDDTPEDRAQQQFANELLAVFMRWYEESDLDDQDMYEVGIHVLDQFCGTSLDFDSDFDLPEDN
tara:strand:- start:1917 stop:2108 length:192 start_codon:yes stop_codon:yes gene_type:complete